MSKIRNCIVTNINNFFFLYKQIIYKLEVDGAHFLYGLNAYHCKPINRCLEKKLEVYRWSTFLATLLLYLFPSLSSFCFINGID